MNTDVDFETVRGEKGLSAALLIADKRVLAPVCFLVCPQVSCCAVGPSAAFKSALVAFYLMNDKKKVRKGFNSTEIIDVENVS